ncbi:hypothetical protein [Methylorubrum thiocyanatum]|uniref:hypothetical protein n=1 Tax=Methylorubrum TaxID=2282523 RepID=UPI00364F839C
MTKSAPVWMPAGQRIVMVAVAVLLPLALLPIRPPVRVNSSARQARAKTGRSV